MNVTRQSLLYRSINCSEGDIWVFENTGQCVEDAKHKVGFGFGVVASVVWPMAQLGLYKFQRRHVRGGKKSNARIIVMCRWLSDVFSLVGTLLAQQLATQVIFCATALLLDTILSIHCILVPPKKHVFKYIKVPTNKRKRTIPQIVRMIKTFSRWSLPLCTFIGLTTMAEFEIFIHSKRDEGSLSVSQNSSMEIEIPPIWVAGYTFGGFAAFFTLAVLCFDMCDSYITVECNRNVILAYLVLIFADVSYVFGVLSQDISVPFIKHTLPWTFPRLSSAGFNTGIVLQRLLMYRQGKKRKLPNEDADCLLSSDSGEELLSSAEDEEITWVPLKTVQDTAKIQKCSHFSIVSESEGLSDTTQATESRRNSQPTLIGVIDDNNGNQQEKQEDEEAPEVEDGQPSTESNLENHISTLNSASRQEKIANWIRNSIETADDEMVQTEDQSC